MFRKMNKRLREVTPEFETKGIFQALEDLSAPWAGTISPELLDLEYYLNESGLKIISPLVSHKLVNGVLGDYAVGELAQIALAIHGTNWSKEFATLAAQYDPISNYDMVENLTDDTTEDEFGHTNTRTNNLSHTKTGTENRQDNLADNRTVNLSDAETLNLSDARTANLTDERTADLTDERTQDLTDERTADLAHTKTGTETKAPGTTITAEDTVFGFNSATGSPSNTREQTSSGLDTTTYNLEETDTGTDTTTHSGTDTTTHSGTDTTTHTGTDTTLHTGTDTTLHTGTDNTTHSGTSGVTYNTTDTDSGTQVDAESGKNTRTRNYTLTRKGNIGVTTSQQMLQSERDLWVWNFFRDVVFPDLDYILTIPVY